jgi:hypothetical protein
LCEGTLMCFGLSVGRCVEAPPGKKKPPKPHEGYRGGLFFK